MSDAAHACTPEATRRGPVFVTLNCPACWDGVIEFVVPYPPPPRVEGLACPACGLVLAANIERSEP